MGQSRSEKHDKNCQKSSSKAAKEAAEEAGSVVFNAS